MMSFLIGDCDVRLLLDTCAMIRLCAEPEALSSKASTTLKQASDAELFISDATIFEVALKHSTGKLILPLPPREWFTQQCDIWEISTLPLTPEELYRSAELPFHHKDPFDRLIIATAMSHCLPVISSDRVFKEYGVEVIW